jgi:hypothetical protein
MSPAFKQGYWYTGRLAVKWRTAKTKLALACMTLFFVSHSLEPDVRTTEEPKEEAYSASMPYPWFSRESEHPPDLLSTHDMGDTNTCPIQPLKPVFVVFTSIPSRYLLLSSNVKFLLNQTYPAKIIISIPILYERFGQSDSDTRRLQDTAGELCLKHHRVHCMRGPDFGPASKLLIPLQLFDEMDVHLIVLDDDQLYSPHIVCDFLVLGKVMPGHAVTRMTRSLSKEKCPGAYNSSTLISDATYTNRRRTFSESALVMGTSGYFVNSAFFSADIFRYNACPPSMQTALFLNDDIWISAHLRKNGVPIVTCLTGLIVPLPRLDYRISSAEGKRQLSRPDGLWKRRGKDAARTAALETLEEFFCNHTPKSPTHTCMFYRAT